MRSHRKTHKSADFRSIYSNNVQFTVTPWDVVFMFGENQEAKRKENVLIVEQHTKIIMSPQHAKVFWNVLGEQIVKYEQAFGPIPVPGFNEIKKELPNRA